MDANFVIGCLLPTAEQWIIVTDMHIYRVIHNCDFMMKLLQSTHWVSEFQHLRSTIEAL